MKKSRDFSTKKTKVIFKHYVWTAKFSNYTLCEAVSLYIKVTNIHIFNNYILFV